MKKYIYMIKIFLIEYKIILIEQKIYLDNMKKKKKKTVI